MINADNPIQDPGEDVLGRTSVARHFAEQLLSLEPANGVVVGVLGPWGSGKTSFVNLALKHLETLDIKALDFNPWMFSGSDQLVESFFIEISSQLKLRSELADVGQSLDEYGELFSGLGWLPVVGPWVERGQKITKLLGQIMQQRKEGSKQRRAKVEKALRDLGKPIVVVIDDIDRLTTIEIRDIFKLVRLTANFPNIIYIVAFDRVRVEQALAEQGLPGRDYLEKILQVSIDLPVVPTNILTNEILESLDSALSSIENPGRFDDGLWLDVFMEVIRPLIRNIRDVRRYVAAAHGTVASLNGQIALVDVLALEAIRVFLPDVFRQLHESIAGLTTTYDPGYSSRSESPRFKQQIELLIESAENRGEVIRALIRRFFPAAERHIGGSHYGGEWQKGWLRERRVGHEAILRLYLERVAGEALVSFNFAEQAWKHMAEQSAFDDYLRSLKSEQVEGVISSLEVYEDQFSSEHVVPGIIVLLNILPSLPERRRVFLSLDTRMVVLRVVVRLLRSLDNANEVEKVANEILPQVTTLSSKMHLFQAVGYQDGVGHELVSESVALGFEQEWRGEVLTATPEALASERDLLRVMYEANRLSGGGSPSVHIADSPDITLALLRSARSEVQIQSGSSRAISRAPRLHWNVLIELFGDESTLRERVEKLKRSQLEYEDDLLQLAEKYLAGWRPNDFK